MNPEIDSRLRRIYHDLRESYDSKDDFLFNLAIDELHELAFKRPSAENKKVQTQF